MTRKEGEREGRKKRIKFLTLHRLSSSLFALRLSELQRWRRMDKRGGKKDGKRGNLRDDEKEEEEGGGQ